jgi:hypothetical protein
MAKLRPFATLVDEARADAEAVVLATDGQVPHGPALVECVLLDRLLRSARQPDAEMTPGAAAGVLLFQWFWARDVFARSGDRVVGLDVARAVDACRVLVEEVGAIERIGDDARHTAAAIEFAQSLVGPVGPDQRVPVPGAFRSHVLARCGPLRDRSYSAQFRAELTRFAS